MPQEKTGGIKDPEERDQSSEQLGVATELKS